MDVVLLSVIPLLLLAHIPGVEVSEHVTGHPVVRQLLDAYVDWRLTRDPYCASRIGELGEYHRLQDYTEDTFRRRVTFASAMLSDARGVDRGTLNKDDHLNLGILIDQLETFIDGFPFRKFGAYNPYNRWRTPFNVWKVVIGSMKVTSDEDAELVFGVFATIARQIDHQMALMNESIRLHTINTVEMMSGVLDVFDTEISKLVRVPILSQFLRPFAVIPLITPNRFRLRSIAKQKSRSILLPAFTRMRQFLSTLYLKNAQPGVGLWALPNGTDYYRASLRWHLSLNVSAEEVHELGISEVERVSDKIQKLIRPYQADGDIHAYMTELRSRRENYYETREELVESLRSIIAETHRKLPQLLRRVPTLPVVVRELERENMLTAGYSAPSWDGSTPGVFFINPSSVNTTPKFEFVSIILHEAEPGHHTHTAHAIESNISRFRKVISCRVQYALPFSMPDYTAYSEGWGLYSESLGEEINAYTEPNALWGRYAAEIFRATRLVVDTGIHAFGWSRQRAIDYMANHTTLDRHIIEKEVTRYTIMPGQACAYKIGEIKIRQLRTRAENILGSRFDKRDFHEAILETGTVPLYLLDQAIDQWIRDTLASPVVSGEAPVAPSVLCFAIVVWQLMALHM